MENEIPALKKKVEGESCTEDQQRRYELLPDYIESLKSETGRDRLKLSRLSDVIKNYEKISGGDYIGSFVREQQAQEALARQSELQTPQHHKGLK